MPVPSSIFGGEEDWGVIASRVAEQLANTNAASTSERQKKVNEIAKRPLPIKSVTVTHKPDGTMDQITTVKNAPQQDPAQEAQAAGAAPQSEYLQHVVAPIIHGGAATISALPDPEAIDPSLLADRKGRERLLKDSGLDAAFEHKPGEGLLGMAARLDKRDELLNNPDLLKRLVMAQRFRQRAAIADQVRPFNADASAADTQKRLNATEDRQVSAEARREHSAEMSQFNTAIDNVRSFDLSGSMKTADDAVNYWKQGYGPAWDEWGQRLEPIIRSEFDRRKLDRDIKDAKEQRDAAKDERSKTEWGLRLQNLESMIASRDRKQNTQSISRRDAIETPANELLSYVGDDGYDQKSVTRALRTKENTLREERNKLTAAIAVASPTVNVMAKKEPWKQSEIAGHIAKIKANQKRLAEIDADLGMLQNNGAAPGRTLTRDEALQKLKGQ